MRGLVVMILVGAWLGWSPALEANPLEQAAFAAKPAELLQAARALRRGDEDAAVLREEDHTRFDAHGRRRRTRRMVIAIYTEGGAQLLSPITETWLPSLDDRPRIRARATFADGRTAEVSDGTATASPLVEVDGGVSERLQLQLAFPALHPGAVLEYEVIQRDFRLIGDSSLAEAVYPGNSLRTVSTNVTIAAPRALPLKVVPRGLPATARPVLRDGPLREWSVELGELPPRVQVEADTPQEFSPNPLISFSCNASWREAARSYRAQLEAMLTKEVVPLPAAARQGDPEARLRALLAWLHDHVRWSEIYLPSAGWAPRSPADTVRRGIADSKDAALVLASLLRQAGLPAELVLVQLEDGQEIHPPGPGLNLFNHVIVRTRVDGRVRWLDPSERFVSPGELPARSQGRQALVLDGVSDALIRTPAAVPGDNRVVQTRTYQLQQVGGAQVTELESSWGAFATEARRYYATNTRAEADLQIRAYTRSAYRSEVTPRFTFDEPRALTGPFRSEVSVTKAHTFYGGRVGIDGSIDFGWVFSRLPEVLSAAPAEVAPRRDPYQWRRPYVMELESRLVVPDGYDLPPLPPDTTMPLASASLTRRSRRDGRTLVISHRFDSGKAVLSAAEVDQLRAALHRLREQGARALHFPSIALALADRGEHHAAIRGLEEVARRHPRNANYQTQLAMVYKLAGMIPAARRAASLATRLDAKDSDALVVLALCLGDAGPGDSFPVDRAGQLTALRAAIAVDPGNDGAYAELAKQLSHDDHGWLNDDPTLLREAAELYRNAHELYAEGGHDLAEASVLLLAGAYDEVERKVSAMAPSAARDVLMVTSTAMVRGPMTAARVAGTLARGGKLGVLARASVVSLRGLRQYDVAEQLRAKLLQDEAQAAAAQAPRRRAVEVAQRDPKDPAAAAFAAWRFIETGALPTPAPWPPQLLDALRATAFKRRQARMADGDVVGIAAATDRLDASEIAVQAVGADGWRVKLEAQPEAYYVILRDQRAQLFATTSARDGLGQHVLALLRKGDVAAATRWLDQLARDQRMFHLDDGPLASEWRKTWETDKLPLLAAALLLAPADDATLAELRRCRGLARRACDHALYLSYARRHQWSQAEVTSRPWAKVDAVDGPLMLDRAQVASTLLNAGKPTEAKPYLAAHLREHPDDLVAQYLAVKLALASGTQATLDRALETLGKAAPGASSLNLLAWIYLLQQRDLDDALAGLRLVQEQVANAPNILNTIAALEAELGDDHAITTLQRVGERRARGEFTSADWYVYGRIAESHGLRDDALDAYRKVTPPPRGEELMDAYQLVQRRLTAMGEPTARKPRSKRR